MFLSDYQVKDEVSTARNEASSCSFLSPMHSEDICLGAKMRNDLTEIHKLLPSSKILHCQG